jgi:hypothetical protein
MNSVAWLVEGYDGIGSPIREVVLDKPKPDSWVTVTPLYTAPKELSEGEIKAIELQISEGVACYDDFDFVAFARAILKRASKE